MTSYTRDDQLAVQPETNVGGRIETSGAYVGHFTLAKEKTAKTGTKGIEFNFECEDGRVARYLSLWLTRANGEKTVVCLLYKTCTTDCTTEGSRAC
jgi:hypothetical protein